MGSLLGGNPTLSPETEAYQMGRSHDYHCSRCHDWIPGDYVGSDVRCVCGGETFYDLNGESCQPQDGDQDICPVRVR